MDPAVALVQAYLQLNGYLTVAEFPIIARSRTGVEAITDIDLIALRFPAARPLGGERDSPRTDPALRVGDAAMDLMICEVKEGKARINRNLARRETLRAVLERVACCPAKLVDHHARQLERHGEATMEHPGGMRCNARIVVFAGRGTSEQRAALVIGLGHVARQVCRFLSEHHEALHGLRLTQPALAQLHLLEKLGVLGRHRDMDSREPDERSPQREHAPN